MKFLPLLLILLFALTSAVQAQASGREEIMVNGISAIVNDEVITRAQVNAAIATQFRLYLLENQTIGRVKQEAKLKELQAASLDDLINKKLIISEFKKQGGAIKSSYIDQAVDTFIRERFAGDDKKFYSELKKQNLTVKQFREIQEEQIIIGALRRQNSGPEIIVNTPQERREWWDNNKEQFAEDPLLQMRMLSIPIQTSDGPASEAGQRKLTEEIRGKIVGGADFGTMAQTYSKDFFAEQGGSVGTIDRDGLTRDITNVAFELPVRQVSDIVEQGGYFRLLYIDAKQGGKVPPYSTMEEQVDKLLLQEKRKGYMERWLNRLRKDADIRIFE
jgi:parvulin-like peptidyl-prolyl isomerase